MLDPLMTQRPPAAAMVTPPPTNCPATRELLETFSGS
jgi:hypothetical protein